MMSTTSTATATAATVSPVRPRTVHKVMILSVPMPDDLQRLTLATLKVKQVAFINHICSMVIDQLPADHTQGTSWGTTNCIALRRSFLKQIANDFNMAYAPAWIVKNTDRAMRGYYLIPELNMAIAESRPLLSAAAALRAAVDGGWTTAVVDAVIRGKETNSNESN